MSKHLSGELQSTLKHPTKWLNQNYLCLLHLNAGKLELGFPEWCSWYVTTVPEQKSHPGSFWNFGSLKWPTSYSHPHIHLPNHITSYKKTTGSVSLVAERYYYKIYTSLQKLLENTTNNNPALLQCPLVV